MLQKQIEAAAMRSIHRARQTDPMTYRENCTLPAAFLQGLCEHGLDALPQAITLLLKAAMQAEREKYLGAAPYERNPDQRDYANGYRNTAITSRVGTSHSRPSETATDISMTMETGMDGGRGEVYVDPYHINDVGHLILGDSDVVQDVARQ